MNTPQPITPRRKLPPLNALRAFEVSGRLLSFRVASDELGVTQGAVAQQVRALETHLGQPLFHRLPRGLRLTAQGAAYLAEVSRAFDTLGAATARLASHPRRVIISVTPTVATRLLIPRLAALQQALPGVELRTIADENLPDFTRDEVDIAIGLATPPLPPLPPDLEARLLIAQRVIAVASPRLLEGKTLPLAAADLRDLPVLHHCQDHWPAFLGQQLSGPRFGLTTLALDAALAGQGVVLVAAAFIGPELADGRLVQVMPHLLRASPDYHIVRRARGEPDAVLETVWDWCLTTLSAP